MIGNFDTLRENLALLKIDKFQSKTEVSIGFCLETNPKLTLPKGTKTENRRHLSLV